MNLLVAAIDNAVEVPLHLDPAIAAATAATTDALVILLVTDPSPSWFHLQTLLGHVYVQASKHHQDNLLLDVSVLLRPALSPDAIPAHAVRRCFRVHDNLLLPDFLASVPVTYLPSLPRPSPSQSIPLLPPSPSCPVVAIGGTFDHLHAGHKILLSMAASIATRKVIIGVTVDALLKNKTNPHLLESFPTRRDKTRAFLTLFRPDLDYDLVPLEDVCGPTAYDPDVQAIVVSKETISGAATIDKERARKGLPPLRTFVIDVISSVASKLDHEDAETLKQTKMSSTLIREWIASNTAR